MSISRFFFVIIAMLCLGFANAQTGGIKAHFKVVNTNKEPVAFASINVISTADTTKKFHKVSDSSGLAFFELNPKQLYRVVVSSVNYETTETTITVKNESKLFSFSLTPSYTTLGTVTVKAKKPLIRQEDDKTIVDPEPIAAASTNAYEILEKTPGIFVDQDGKVYVSSLTPTKIYINGREMKMSADDVATMLKNLPPDAISKIEILRTPSAKYDASSNGGIINIVLKKGIKIGFTGSVVAGIQQGDYGNSMTGFNVSNSLGKRSYYLNFNYGNRNSDEHLVTDRVFASDTVLHQDADTKSHSTNYFTGYGFSDSLSSKWYLDFSGTFNYQKFKNSSQNENKIQESSTNGIFSNSLNSTNYSGKSFNFNNGIRLSHPIDSASEWTTDFYYAYDRNRNNQQYKTSFYSPIIFSSGGYGSPNSSRSNFTFSSDLKKKLAGKVTVETGIKASFLKYKSDADYFKGIGTASVKDINRTVSFNYTENINSAYLQASKTFGKNVILKAGGRVENTSMSGHQVVPADTVFSIHRTDFFPYVYLSKKIITIAGYDLRAYLVARRTILRPTYDQLNPFLRYVDQYLNEGGNPDLKPQFVNNYEANVSVDEKPLLAVGINDSKDIFSQVVYTSDSSHTQSFRTYDNLGKSKEWYFRGLGVIPPGKRYFFVLGGQYNYISYQGIYESKPLNYSKGTWTFFTYHSFKIDKRSQLSANGFVRFKGQQGFYELGTFGALNANVNRRFMKERLTVTLSANDIFKTNKNTFVINQGSVHASGLREGDTRRFGLNVRYNFGFTKKDKKEDDIFEKAQY